MNLENVKLGPCNVSIDGTDVGATKGGVTVEITQTTEASDWIDYDPNWDVKITATEVKCTVPLAETTVENLQLAFPHLSFTSSGAKRQIKITSGITKLRDYSVPLVITPINKTSDNEIVTISKAVPVGIASISYTNGQERVFNLQFKGLVESSSDSTLIMFGDPTT